VAQLNGDAGLVSPASKDSAPFLRTVNRSAKISANCLLSCWFLLLSFDWDTSDETGEICLFPFWPSKRVAIGLQHVLR
jgi:hypothetical protein